ncbi:Protein of unknown function [Pyronema omphalodes CBS 100304]|uniref:Uncharacterized protein n=1 Tax=Pyronema omphalodes (strain CBS 100304) TaxID=1076935 RepID=U4LG55_PYROM|nr:Protein of unknown function [Pyronema omphalodes CBS 100304]
MSLLGRHPSRVVYRVPATIAYRGSKFITIYAKTTRKKAECRTFLCSQNLRATIKSAETASIRAMNSFPIELAPDLACSAAPCPVAPVAAVAIASPVYELLWRELEP